jgi:hypothetical protein
VPTKTASPEASRFKEHYLTDLQPFEGSDVVAAKIEIPNAAGGLRDAMEFEPVEMHHGDEGYIALHYKVKKVRFDPHSKDDPDALVRVHVLNALNAAFIDEVLVGEHLRTQQLRIQKQREDAQGIQRLDIGADDATLVKEHDEGLHPVQIAGCPACDEREEDRTEDR